MPSAGAREQGALPASVLVVCTGNICRSPAAERLLAARLAPAGVEVRSAGTGALVGEPVHPPMAELLRARGVDPDRFTARALQPAHLRQAGLVLVMARAHRSAAVAMMPAVVRRTFLLVEAAEIAARIAADGWPGSVAPEPAARLAALPALAAPYRLGVTEREVEVPDPYRRSPEAYRESLRVLEAAVDRLTRAVGAGPAAETRAPRTVAPASPSGEPPYRGGDAA
jgi:protein-tyrosine phosphatase